MDGWLRRAENMHRKPPKGQPRRRVPGCPVVRRQRIRGDAWEAAARGLPRVGWQEIREENGKLI